MRNKLIVYLSLALVILLFFVVSCDKKVDEGGAVNTSLQSSTADKTTVGESDIEYRLDIEDDVMSSPRVLSLDELDDCGYAFYDISRQYEYEEAAHFPIRTSDNEYGTIELFYTDNSEKSINVEVSEELISADELRPMAEITICLDTCTVRVCAWADGNNPVVLPPEVETVLRTILCIE